MELLQKLHADIHADPFYVSFLSIFIQMKLPSIFFQKFALHLGYRKRLSQRLLYHIEIGWINRWNHRVVSDNEQSSVILIQKSIEEDWKSSLLNSLLSVTEYTILAYFYNWIR